MMDIDARHSLLREKLNNLGFTQPLPLGSLAIVSALLDDLLLKNRTLKDAKKTIAALEKEKTAWELNCEPYKCDNSKLLAECNSLNLDVMRQRDIYQQKILELNKSLRNLELENRSLKHECDELTKKLTELDPKQRKSCHDLLNQKRKPFISTVRSGEFLSSASSDMDAKSKCFCQPEKNGLMARLYAEQEANKVKTQLELMELFKSQIESRNREISRLNQLLVGGRPTLALAKDCCYRDIGSLAADLQKLQREKAQIEANYEQSIKSQNHALEQIARLTADNSKLNSELSDIKDIALNVESEANTSLQNLHKRNTALKLKLQESKRRIEELEMNHDRSSASKEANAADMQIKFLQEQLQALTDKDCDLKTELEKLTKKNAKLKGKLSADACKCSAQILHTKEEGTMTFEDGSIDVNRLKTDRDFYHAEYLKLVNKPLVDGEVNLLRRQLIEKDYEIRTLRKQLDLNTVTQEPAPCRAIEATILRLEREKKLLQSTVDQLKVDCDELRQSMHLSATTQRDQCTKDESQLEWLRQRIRQIESENLSFKTLDATTKSTIAVLKEEITHLKAHILELNEENANLRTTSKQLRLLQDQTENALVEHQSRLTHCERQRSQAESRLNTIDSSRADGCREVAELRADNNRLKALNLSLAREKDKIIVDLDRKTEELFQLEPQMDSLKARVFELEAELANIHHQMSNISTDNKHSRTSLEQAASDVEKLRYQVKHLKSTNDNAMYDNRRLTDELAEVQCHKRELETKQIDAEKEIDRMKRQLQQYVQEVQRAEELLQRKEEERNDMLDQFKILSHDAVTLEGTNQSLELEAAETKRNVIELESKLTQLRMDLKDHEKELHTSKRRECELSKQVNQLELDVQRYKHERDLARKELDAEKDLCAKLDIEIEKLKDEVQQYSDIRQDLERMIDRLRSDLLVAETGGRAETDTMKQLLSGTRKELDAERYNSSKLRNDIERTISRIKELEEQIAIERANAITQETQAKEYSVQIQELSKQLTDIRFQQMQSSLDQSNDKTLEHSTSI